MAMTRKDYQLIADCINKACESYNKIEGISTETKFDYVHGIVSLRNRLAFELIETNPRFNKEKFMEATFKASEIENTLYNEKWEGKWK